MNTKKTVIALALGLVFGVAASANAAVVTGITIKDVGSTLNLGGGTSIYSPTLDGKSGAFRFVNWIDPSYTNPSVSLYLWRGDVGTGTLRGQGASNPVGSFSTGFIVPNPSAPVIPFTYGAGFKADITGGMLNVSTMDFGANFNGASVNLSPDAGTFKVNWVNQVGTAPDDYNVSFQWSRVITSADDPSGGYVGFSTNWLIEGVAHTAAPVPVPAAAWLLGSGLVSLVAVARRRKTA